MAGQAGRRAAGFILILKTLQPGGSSRRPALRCGAAAVVPPARLCRSLQRFAALQTAGSARQRCCTGSRGSAPPALGQAGEGGALVAPRASGGGGGGWLCCCSRPAPAALLQQSSWSKPSIAIAVNRQSECRAAPSALAWPACLRAAQQPVDQEAERHAGSHGDESSGRQRRRANEEASGHAVLRCICRLKPLAPACPCPRCCAPLPTVGPAGSTQAQRSLGLPPHRQPWRAPAPLPAPQTLQAWPARTAGTCWG